MKINQVAFIFPFFLAIVLVAGSGCEGPAGPDGNTGPQGEMGPPGQQGPQGQDGTANVIYSEWFNFTLENWTDSFSLQGQTRREYPVDVPQIDENILERGTVMVYVRGFGNNQGVRPLPIIQPIFIITRDAVLNFRFDLGKIHLEFYNIIERTIDPGRIGPTRQFRYIIIPGGVPAKAIEGHPDLNNYHEVMEYFGIDP